MDQVAKDLITKIKIYSENIDPCGGVAYEENPCYYQTMTFKKLIKEAVCLECIHNMSHKIDYYCALEREEEEKRCEKIRKETREKEIKKYEEKLKKMNRLKEELGI
jgi:hypothetical protein